MDRPGIPENATDGVGREVPSVRSTMRAFELSHVPVDLTCAWGVFKGLARLIVMPSGEFPGENCSTPFSQTFPWQLRSEAHRSALESRKTPNGWYSRRVRCGSTGETRERANKNDKRKKRAEQNSST